MQDTISSLVIGRAGELRVCSELLVRGFRPAIYEIDDGTDILVGGKAIAVKTSLKPMYTKNSYSWKYGFNLRPLQTKKVKDGHLDYRPDYREKNDFFIFCLWDINVFYIIPSKELGAKVSLVISAPSEKRIYKRHKEYKSISKYERYKNNWEILR